MGLFHDKQVLATAFLRAVPIIFSSGPTALSDRRRDDVLEPARRYSIEFTDGEPNHRSEDPRLQILPGLSRFAQRICKVEAIDLVWLDGGQKVGGWTIES